MERDRGKRAIELIDVSKAFGPVVANDEISIAAAFGEVHAIVGEDGAGKSTLMSIIAGLYRPDSGRLWVAGQPVSFRSPRDAIERGIGIVYRHYMLIETMTVAGNVLVGLPGGGEDLAPDAVGARLRELSSRFELDIDPDASVWQLTAAEQQRVEILRLFYRGARILLLDEPTAALAPDEVERLSRSLRLMAADGCSVLVISRRLDEALAVADRITVLRRGRIVGTVPASATDRHSLAQMMVGPEPGAPAPDRSQSGTELVIRVARLRVIDETGSHVVNDLSLEVRGGEVLGITGLPGNGQRELAEAVAGLRRSVGGQVTIGERDIANRSAATVAAAGLAYIPEERLTNGLNGGVADSASAPPLVRGPLRRALGAVADRLSHEHGATGSNHRVRPQAGPNTKARLVARELAGAPAVIVASNPTRALEADAASAIHALIRAHRDRGAAVLLISEDVDELHALADRTAIISRGRLIETLPAGEVSKDRLGELLTGGVPVLLDAAVLTSTPEPTEALNS